jgi:mRNA-degrading endonuclease RelE of RelBE toxin-antitoxin system
MPYKARFSRIFLKKYEKLPKNIKPGVFETIKEILMNPHSESRSLGLLRVYGELELENIG